MTLEELWELFPIILKEYNHEYPKWYKIEKNKLIKTIYSNDIERINHIGSTAVKGLIAKPTIDILLELRDGCKFDEIINEIAGSGWILMASQEKPYKKRTFNKGYSKFGFEEKVYHLHVRVAGDCDELYFRDYLIENPEIAAEYGQLKLDLLERYRNNRDGYTEAKNEFVSKYTIIARQKYGKKYFVEKN